MEGADQGSRRVATRRSNRVPRTHGLRPSSQHRLPEAQRRQQSENIIDLTADNDSTHSAARTDDKLESIAEDDVCPICQLLLYRPVITGCNHTLCEACMATWADVSVITQMQIVDVDEAPIPFNAVSGLEARCPMCRTQTSATLDRNRHNELGAKYPQTHAERQSEHNTEHTDGERGEIQTLTLSIGNRHKLVDTAEDGGNVHDWTFFVRPSRPEIVEEIHIHLHPTFQQSRIIRTRPPYEIRRLGWGYFTIVAYVMLKPGYSWVSEDAETSPDGAEKGMLGLEWTLDFERFGGRGSMGRLKLKVRNQRDWEDMSDEEEEDQRERERLRRQYESDGQYVPEGEV